MNIYDQYDAVKAEHPGCVPLFRNGDFFETYRDDAKRLSKILGLTLSCVTRTDTGERLPMAGFPHHHVDAYLMKLVQAGERVAVCEFVNAQHCESEVAL